MMAFIRFDSGLAVETTEIVAAKRDEPYHPVQAMGHGWRVEVLLAHKGWVTLRTWPEHFSLSCDREALDAADGVEAAALYEQIVTALEDR